jgi:hypothetical protein
MKDENFWNLELTANKGWRTKNKNLKITYEKRRKINTINKYK